MTRLTQTLASIAAGLLLGVILVVGWGENLRWRSVGVEGFGIFTRVQLPPGVVSKDEVSSFWMEISGNLIDAGVARVSLNNYYALSGETPDVVIASEMQTDESARFLKTKMVQRKLNVKSNQVENLRNGRNFIVFDLENNHSGNRCRAGFMLTINDETLQGIPSGLPDGFDPREMAQLQRTKNTDNIVFEDALCSRRIVQLDLGVKPASAKRLWDFLVGDFLGAATHSF